MKLTDVIIVLCRPEEPGNVGAVCRAMKNMGLSRLRLAAPAFGRETGAALTEAGAGYGGSEAVIRARAVHAVDVWEQAETFGSLAEAIADCSLVIGATRRRGQRRKLTATPWEAAALLQTRPGPAALVFGNERAGLSQEEIEQCGLASHIPANEAFPSLNLSHAVMIYAYECARALGSDAGPPVPMPKGTWEPLDQTRLTALARELSASLRTLGFYTQRDSAEQERFFQDLFARAGLTEREGRYFASIVAKAARLALKAGGKGA